MIGIEARDSNNPILLAILVTIYLLKLGIAEQSQPCASKCAEL